MPNQHVSASFALGKSLHLDGFPYLLSAVIFPLSGEGVLQKPSCPPLSRSTEAAEGRITAQREILVCNAASPARHAMAV